MSVHLSKNWVAYILHFMKTTHTTRLRAIHSKTSHTVSTTTMGTRDANRTLLSPMLK